MNTAVDYTQLYKVDRGVRQMPPSLAVAVPLYLCIVYLISYITEKFKRIFNIHNFSDTLKKIYIN